MTRPAVPGMFGATMAAPADIQLLPDGTLHASREALSALPKAVRAAWAVSPEAGLVTMAVLDRDDAMAPGTTFWAALAKDLVTRRCRAEGAGGPGVPEPVPPDPGEAASRAAAAPPAPGMEYLTAAVVVAQWEKLSAALSAAADAHAGGFRGWLEALNPGWAGVGRVTFHLAENPRDDDRPFAFLATFPHRVGPGGKLQHAPLGRALKSYAESGERGVLASILTPLQKAAERDAFARRMLVGKEVFKPLAWTPADAFAFLEAVPAFEAAGVVVRLPDWWEGGAPPRPEVVVTLGDHGGSAVGLAGMLGFDVRLALGGHDLTPEEWERVRSAGPGLVSIKGRWVRADPEKLEEALAQWRRAEAAAAGSGIGFLHGMRLLAGLSGGTPGLPGTAPGAPVRFRAAPSLEDRLRALREAAPAPPAPNPALKASLRPYQAEGVAWLWQRYGCGLGACLADDMGLGKTLQVLALLLEVNRRGPARGPALLVVPASLVANWVAEAGRFAPSLRVFVAHRSVTSREVLQAAAARLPGCDAVVTTYAMVGRMPSLSRTAWDLVVLDEAQAIKNPGAAQARAVKALRARARIALTGTPVENEAADLWSLFDFLNPGLLGPAGAFAALVRDGGPAGFAAVRRAVAPFLLRRLKTDPNVITDLPPKTSVRTGTPLTRGQALLYQKSVRQLSADLRSQALDRRQRAGLALTYLTRLKQICDHPALWTGSGNFGEKDSGKLRVLRELAHEIASRGEKGLVFTQFREMVAPLAAFLASVVGRPVPVLHGGTPVGERQRRVDRFQSDPGIPFFVISLKAGGTGLNLTAASHVVHFDRWWNPATEDQATDRAYRIGQTRPVLVHQMVSPGTVEEKIANLLEEKRGLAEALLGSPGSAVQLGALGDDELVALYALDPARALG